MIDKTITTIYFIRHGDVDNPAQVVYGRRDFPLSESGISQMKRLASYYKALGINPDIIVTSPMKRAVQSAEKLQETFSTVKIMQDERLQESDVEALEGKSIDWNNSIQRDVYTFAKNNGISIEFPENIIRRMGEILDDLLEKHKGKTILAISHGDPITFLLWRLTHPSEEIPLYVFLTKGSFLRTAQSWEVIFDDEGNVLSRKLVSTQ